MCGAGKEGATSAALPPRPLPQPLHSLEAVRLQGVLCGRAFPPLSPLEDPTHATFDFPSSSPSPRLECPLRFSLHHPRLQHHHHQHQHPLPPLCPRLRSFDTCTPTRPIRATFDCLAEANLAAKRERENVARRRCLTRPKLQLWTDGRTVRQKGAKRGHDEAAVDGAERRASSDGRRSSTTRRWWRGRRWGRTLGEAVALGCTPRLDTPFLAVAVTPSSDRCLPPRP